MKFFEGIRNIANKKGVAAAEAALLLSATACDKRKEQTISEDNKQKTEVGNVTAKKEDTNNPEFYRQKYLEYMEHPSYKQRLAKEMFGDEVIDEEKKKSLDKEYKKRIKWLKNDLITIVPPGYFGETDSSGCITSEENSIIKTEPEAIFHELSHSIDWRYDSPNYYGFEDKKKYFIYLKEMNEARTEKIKSALDLKYNEYIRDQKQFTEILKNYIIENKNSLEFTPLVISSFHGDREVILGFILRRIAEEERAFDLHRIYDFLSVKDIENISNKNKKLFESFKNYQKILDKEYKPVEYDVADTLEYLYRDTEIKARLIHLRFRAMNEFNFDLNNEFDINKFEKLKEDRQYKDLKDYLGLPDEKINELMKYTAFNNSKNIFYPPGSSEKKFKEGYHIPGIDYGEGEG